MTAGYIHVVQEHEMTKKYGHREEWPDNRVEVVINDVFPLLVYPW
jgi:hypothetical protein